MRNLLIWITALWVALGGPTQAEDSPVVVELFTSQGCSSCPPADALLAELAGREDVIPLALHVDYWDYIGWKDQFAHPRFTKRQKGYARAGGWRSIYTPQIVVNGTEDVIGSRPMKVADLIRKHAARETPVDLEVSRKGGQLVVRMTAGSPVGAADIHVLRYLPHRDANILRGENAGRSYRYTHIVTAWEVVGRWDGRRAYEKRLKIDGAAPVVVLVQKPKHGPILAATRLR